MFSASSCCTVWLPLHTLFHTLTSIHHVPLRGSPPFYILCSMLRTSVIFILQSSVGYILPSLLHSPHSILCFHTQNIIVHSLFLSSHTPPHSTLCAQTSFCLFISVHHDSSPWTLLSSQPTPHTSSCIVQYRATSHTTDQPLCCPFSSL